MTDFKQQEGANDRQAKTSVKITFCKAIDLANY